MILNWFTSHPRSVGMTYYQHFKGAFCFGLWALYAGIATVIHAFLPFLFPATGGDVVEKLYNWVTDVRNRDTSLK